MQKKYTNFLINETSPYLLQHAHNPVNWYPWGEVALQKARVQNKVILVSIGYSACHWCHVMERESFENEAVAEIMNANFVNIKIDREERPDLDHIYMDAVQAISGGGGWPLNVFLTPQAKPFYGGTYFPPVKAFNRSSWTEILTGISNAWQEKQHEIIAQAENLTAHIQEQSTFIQSAVKLQDGNVTIVTVQECHDMMKAVMKTADKKWGGFGNAPKFPQTFTIRFLLQYHYFTDNTEALQQALLSLDKMLDGGIYDHIDGGLARYSTDAEWLAPHFEKMLYDNALLILALCDAFQLTKLDKYRVGIEKTINFVQQDLTHPDGGFYAALDADSEGEEGKYYVWDLAEINALLGDDASKFSTFFDITDRGNWEGKNIPRKLKSLDEFIAEHGYEKESFELTIQLCIKKLSEARKSRIKPGLDDKIILAWNAMMLKAIAKAAIVLQKNDFAEIAEKNYEFLIQKLKRKDLSEFFHTVKNDDARYPAFLDDYANLIAAAIQVYNINFEDKYLHDAKSYCTYVVENFSDNENLMFYYTGRQQQDVIIRKKEVYDGAVPSGNALMAENLNMLASYFDMPDWKKRSQLMVASVAGAALKYPSSFGNWASFLLQEIAGGLNEIVITGKNSVDVGKITQLTFIPNVIFLVSEYQKNTFSLLKNKQFGDSPLIYLCKNNECKLPVAEITGLMSTINKSNKIR